MKEIPNQLLIFFFFFFRIFEWESLGAASLFKNIEAAPHIFQKVHRVLYAWKKFMVK